MLLARWQAGDQAAAEAIYQRYAQRLCALAEKDIGERLARRVGPEDIVQSVFRTFFRRSGDGQFAIDHSGARWRLLVRITANKVLRHAEREGAARRDVKAEVHGTSDGLEPALICHDPTLGRLASYLVLSRSSKNLRNRGSSWIARRSGSDAMCWRSLYPISQISQNKIRPCCLLSVASVCLHRYLKKSRLLFLAEISLANCLGKLRKHFSCGAPPYF